MALRCHDACALKAELHARIGVYGVCYPYLDYTFGAYGYLSRTQVTDTLRQKIVVLILWCPFHKNVTDLFVTVI